MRCSWFLTPPGKRGNVFTFSYKILFKLFLKGNRGSRFTPYYGTCLEILLNIQANWLIRLIGRGDRKCSWDLYLLPVQHTYAHVHAHSHWLSTNAVSEALDLPVMGLWLYPIQTPSLDSGTLC